MRTTERGFASDDSAIATRLPNLATSPPNKKHLSRSLERHIHAPREHVWQVLNDLVEEQSTGYISHGQPEPNGAGAVLNLELPGLAEPLVETVLSFEPPWRRAYSLSGDSTGLDLCHGTFVLRDDGSECHLSWGMVVDPEPSAKGLAFLEMAVATIDRFLDLVVVKAELHDTDRASSSTN